jgi:hypothetical protein
MIRVIYVYIQITKKIIVYQLLNVIIDSYTIKEWLTKKA